MPCSTTRSRHLKSSAHEQPQSRTKQAKELPVADASEPGRGKQPSSSSNHRTCQEQHTTWNESCSIVRVQNRLACWGPNHRVARHKRCPEVANTTQRLTSIGLLKNTPGKSAALPASLQAAAVGNYHRGISSESIVKLSSYCCPCWQGRILSQWPL
jgi:hypothetical protein